MHSIIAELKDRFGKRSKLKPFFEFASELPDSFEFDDISFFLAGPGEARKMRNQFRQAASIKKIYIHIGENFASELAEIGIPNLEIDRMIHRGRRPRGRQGERLDFTLDHMKSLFLSGRNNPENICIMPSKINSWKNVLEQLQIEAIKKDYEHRRSGNIVTLLPKMRDGIRNQVPFIEGGYSEWNWEPAQ